MLNPHIIPKPSTVNETLYDRMVRHLLYLTRLQNLETNWVLGNMNDNLFPDINDQVATAVARLDGMGNGTNLLTLRQLNYLKSFQSGLMQSVSSRLNTIRDDFFSRLTGIASHELDFEHRLMQKTIPIRWNFKVPAMDQITGIMRSQPFDGKPLNEWFRDLSTGTTSRITNAIREGMMNGDSIDQIVRRIRGTRTMGYTDGILQTTRYHAEAIARSAVIFTSNQATSKFYDENSDLISKLMWVATLDARTCVICGKLDGQKFPLNEGIRPPAHVNCRCVMVPVVKSWKQLGIDITEAPAGTRASMNGQVPESLTYEQWLKRQPMNVVVEALGKTRAKLFKKGDLSLSSFTNRRNRILNLDQIKSLESDLFKKLNLN